MENDEDIHEFMDKFMEIKSTQAKQISLESENNELREELRSSERRMKWMSEAETAHLIKIEQLSNKTDRMNREFSEIYSQLNPYFAIYGFEDTGLETEQKLAVIESSRRRETVVEE